MSTDQTEMIRKQQQAELNGAAAARGELEKKYEKVWNTNELGRDFDVLQFMAPYVVVRRKSDDTTGTLEFQHSPRFYFNFKPGEV